MQDIDRSMLKRWGVEIVGHVSPRDTFVVEDGFDTTLKDWHLAQAQDEGRFVGGAEVTAFATMVVPFLLGFFGDVAKDVIKDQTKKAVGALIEKLLDHKATRDETVKLKKEIDAAIKKSRFSQAQKQTLHSGFEELFAKLGASV